MLPRTLTSESYFVGEGGRKRGVGGGLINLPKVSGEKNLMDKSPRHTKIGQSLDGGEAK